MKKEEVQTIAEILDTIPGAPLVVDDLTRFDLENYPKDAVLYLVEQPSRLNQRNVWAFWNFEKALQFVRGYKKGIAQGYYLGKTSSEKEQN